MSDLDVLAWTIVIGEARGGKYSVKLGRWTKKIPPTVVYAVEATLKANA